MENELHDLIKKIMHAIQNQEFDRIENLDLILKSKDFLECMSKIKISEAEILYLKIQTAIGIINTQKELLLDELTLLQNSKKALNIYISQP